MLRRFMFARLLVRFRSKVAVRLKLYLYFLGSHTHPVLEIYVINTREIVQLRAGAYFRGHMC
jgi:hypothetical protein